MDRNFLDLDLNPDIGGRVGEPAAGVAGERVNTRPRCSLASRASCTAVEVGVGTNGVAMMLSLEEERGVEEEVEEVEEAAAAMANILEGLEGLKGRG